MNPTIILLLILAASIFGKANSVAIATCFLLMAKLLGLDKYVYPPLQKSGMTWGLILLIAAIMIQIGRAHV